MIRCFDRTKGFRFNNNKDQDYHGLRTAHLTNQIRGNCILCFHSRQDRDWDNVENISFGGFLLCNFPFTRLFQLLVCLISLDRPFGHGRKHRPLPEEKS